MTERFDIQRTQKPWGYELLWAKTDQYVGKILHVQAGHALSLQYHHYKDETIYLFSGKAILHCGKSEDALQPLDMNSGDSYHVPPGALHRLEAVTDCDFFEASTPQLEDVVRLNDRYGRAEPAPRP